MAPLNFQAIQLEFLMKFQSKKFKFAQEMYLKQNEVKGKVAENQIFLLNVPLDFMLEK
jgi:hypothetical protein